MSFKRLDLEDITISAESTTAPAWSGQQNVLTQFFLNTSQTTQSGRYYYNVYQTASNATGAEVQFAIAYGNLLGSGSEPINPSIPGNTPSSIVYGQYRTLVNGDENSDFIFGTVTPKSVYIISVNRARFKEKLLPGSFNLTLVSGSKTLHLTDNSVTSNIVSYVDSGRVYDIVSGSNGTPYNNTGFSPNSGSYGKFLPDIGVIVLNGDALKDPVNGINLYIDESYNTATNNINSLYNAIHTGSYFSLKSEETVTSNYIFVRVRNSEFNYSTNPSNISSSGDLLHNVMVNSPQAYMTTVGLYNDNNDLLAVAKLSRPLLKDFTKEALLTIKLDY